MALLRCISGKINYSMHINIAIINEFHTTSSSQLNQDWRRARRLPENPNAFGPLTNLPDYTFLDGRPTPFGIRQMGRIKLQREYFNQIKRLVSEVDFAVENHERRIREKEETKQRIIESKLKPKGEKSLDDGTTAN